MSADHNKYEREIELFREQIPLLKRNVQGTRLVYLDNAATTPKPRSVIQAIEEFYEKYGANVKRGSHTLSVESTDFFEKVRDQVCHWIHAEKREEIIFTRGTTEAINGVAQSLSKNLLKEGDEILISEMEHHANIVSWQLHTSSRGVKIKAFPINEKGELRLDLLESLITSKTKLIAVTHVSNVLGTINPIKQITEIAHRHGILVLVDGAQAVGHLSVDVQDLDCDFYVFSGHKMFGPTGIGVLYGKYKELDRITPWLGGGEMIESVTLEKSTYQKLPSRLEAGTPPISAVFGLGAAIDFLETSNREICEHLEKSLLNYATQNLTDIPGLTIYGNSSKKIPLLSFSLKEVHPHDLSTVFDQMGIAIRAGNHCAQPLMKILKVPATSRISLAFYNTKDEIDLAVKAIHRAIKILRR
jgi:cysteine desulfurase/selenocysteine lyase